MARVLGVMAAATAAMSLMGTKVVVTLHLRGRKLLKREKVPPALITAGKNEKVQPAQLGRVRTCSPAVTSNFQQFQGRACMIRVCVVRLRERGGNTGRVACMKMPFNRR